MVPKQNQAIISGIPFQGDFEQHPCSAEIYLHASQGLETRLYPATAPERKSLEQFVSSVFAKKHGAVIQQYLPLLMSLQGKNGNIYAVCGLRRAELEKLFLENYLQHSIETELSAAFGEEVSRSSIVEVGNLAVLQPRYIRCLLAGITLYLHTTHAEWAVFTAAPILRNSLQRLNIQLLHLGVAAISCLPENERAGWGRYYDQNPQVYAVRRMA